MGSLHFGNIWKLVIDNSRLSEMKEKKLRCKTEVGITLNNIFSLFGGCVPYKKDDYYQK
jgi:hypothetical protein